MNSTIVKYNFNFITPKIVYDTTFMNVRFDFYFYKLCVHVDFENVNIKIFNMFRKGVHD